MKKPLCLAALATAVLAVGSIHAADLSKIERRIAKEPTYQSQPKYCLLVFGPEARTRVWLVLDGKTLYVDRNGDGNLTEPGKKVRANDDDDDQIDFEGGDISDGRLKHRLLRLSVSKLSFLTDTRFKAFVEKHPEAKGYHLDIELELPGGKGTGLGGRVCESVSRADAKGLFQFSDHPQDAPIVHFGGPLQMTLYDWPTLTVGRETELVLGVGTPGLGPGTTAYIEYQGVIPEKAYPVVEVHYPPRRSGEAPIKERSELKGRC